ncbi:MAG: NAD-dependent epimerase/dehydratase family protein, partial [Planctomycetia bacterium]
MKSLTLLVTGSSGLIGSEVAQHFDALGATIHGVDNNQRSVFFGPQGDTRWNQNRLVSTLRSFTHHELDIRDRAGVLQLIETIRP